MAKTVYEIRAAVVRVKVTLGRKRINSCPRVGHHFWILVKVYENEITMLESLHGLATQINSGSDGRSNARIPEPMSTWHSYLQIYSIPYSGQDSGQELGVDLEWTVPDEMYTAYSGTDALTRWKRAESYLAAFNSLYVPYSFCGIGKGLGLIGCKNSNSAYASVAVLLGLEPHRFAEYAAPGLKTTCKILGVSIHNRAQDKRGT